MFAARGIALALAFFAVLYGLLSVLVVVGTRLGMKHSFRPRPSHFVADLLCALRLLPLSAALVVTLGLIVPSFVLLEPRATEEGIGAIPLALGLCGLAVLAGGACKALFAQVKTSRLVSGWIKLSTSVEGRDNGPLFRIGSAAPPLTVAGIRRSRVLLSEAAAAVLTAPELETALRHEMAHIRRHDNLKKLLFAFCAFPGMAPLEEAWREAVEIAADDAAVRDPGEALDLAAALIKLSRLASLAPSAELTTALLQSSGASLGTRVKRLLNWKKAEISKKLRSSRGLLFVSVLGMIVATVMVYSTALTEVHELSERLVR